MMQQAFKKIVIDAYEFEAMGEFYEILRKQFIKDFDASSARVRENILLSHGCLNLVNSSIFDLIKKQLWKIQINFYDHNPATQGCIMNFYFS